MAVLRFSACPTSVSKLSVDLVRTGTITAEKAVFT